MRVLVVEDDADLSGAVERRLRGSGFAVDTAADLPDAEIAIAINRYDCLVLDRAVPSGDTINLVRARRLCRRSVDETPPILSVADLDVDQARAEVGRAGVLLTLTSKELAVLVELASRPGVVVSRTQLIETCWDEATDPMSNTVDVHIASLRRKLGDPALIHTVRGLGYKITAT